MKNSKFKNADPVFWISKINCLMFHFWSLKTFQRLNFWIFIFHFSSLNLFYIFEFLIFHSCGWLWLLGKRDSNMSAEGKLGKRYPNMGPKAAWQALLQYGRRRLRGKRNSRSPNFQFLSNVPLPIEISYDVGARVGGVFFTKWLLLSLWVCKRKEAEIDPKP